MTDPSGCLLVATSTEDGARLLATVATDAAVTVVLPEAQLAALDAGDEGSLLRHADRVIGLRSWNGRTEAETLGRTLRPLVGAHAAVVLGSTQHDRDVAGWLAVHLDAPVVWGVEAVTPGPASVEVVRSIHGGARRVTQLLEAVPAVVLTKGGTRTRRPARPSPATVCRMDLDPAGRLEIVPTGTAAAGPGTSLTGAQVVVAVGRGIGGAEQVPLFEQLAGRLSAALGASRAVVDAGWLPFAHQVGQTGATVNPALYLAFGISGAIQHVAGMRGAQRVVAVNTDPEAPLCSLADLVIAGDAVDQARRLLDLLGD